MKKNHNDPTYYVGYKFTNKQGCNGEIVEYKNNKEILVRFEGSEILVKATGLKIKNGYPMHPTLNKTQVGDRFPCKDGDTVEVVEYVSSTKILCKWLSDGATKWTELSTLKGGNNKHPDNWKFKEGDIVPTNNGDVEVVQYISATDILVRFENGEEKHTSSVALRKGSVKPDGKFKSREGYIFTTNSGWRGEVIEWCDAHNVKVEWQDGSHSHECWASIKSGAIKPLFQPSVVGVGYIGEGKYLPKSYKNLSGGKMYISEEITNYWRRMITRCYSEKEQLKPSGRQYVGCSVVREWHNFQNFAEWAIDNYWCAKIDDLGRLWHLDKDIIVYGNKVYSPDSCVFVPNEVNGFFSKQEIGTTGYMGVNFIKPAYPNAKDGYIARCYSGETREYLGYYDTPQAAYSAYRVAKMKAGRLLAEKWEGKVDSRVIIALNDFGSRLPDLI